jgi:aspartate aminotransferase-like enzyme
VIEATTSNSFAIDLKKWHQIMQAYLNGGHAYHATMPTDRVARFPRYNAGNRGNGFDTSRAGGNRATACNIDWQVVGETGCR